MNKVFKVIWSEARNAYVVVSEIAKNHGSKSSSTKKLLAMLIATGVMTCASFDVLAAEPTAEPTAAQQYVALKAVDFTKGEPTWSNRESWKDSFKNLSEAKKEWDAQQSREKKIGDYIYTYDTTNKYWVRDGYVLTVDENGGKYTPLSANKIRADVAYTKDGVAEGILQSVTSTVEANGTVTNMGESLNKVTAGSFAGVSHSGGTEVAGSWNYIIQDSSWKNSGAAYNNGYVDLIGEKMPKGFITADSNNGLVWDNNKQAYTYRGKAVDYSNVYVIDGQIGVFTNKEGTKVYTGTVYGKHNEILMTVKEANNKFYSYWAAEVTDPSATMATYRVEEYKKNLAVLEENENKLYRNDIKEVTMTKDGDGATIGLLRNGDNEAGTPVKDAIKVTSGGGTGGSGAAHDTYVNISNAADTEGKTFATGSKVEAIVDNGATTGIKINGEDYTIKSGSVVSVAQNDKTTTITVDGKATTITDTDTHNKLNSAKLNDKTLTITGEDNDSVSVDLSSIDTDTKYTAGNGIAISGENNAIAVKLKEGENNLAVTAAGLELNKDLTVDSVKAGATTVNNTGVTIGSSDTGIVLSNSNVSMGGQQIHNVAAGKADTDAVNVGQLNKVVAAGDTDVHIKAGEYKVNDKNKVSMNLVDKAGKDNGTVTITGVAKAEDVAVVYDKNKTSLRSTNARLQTSSKKKEAAVDSIALGNGASAVKESVAIGNGASVVEGSNGLGGVALGYKAHAGYKGTSLGSNAISGREGTTLVGANTNSGSLYTTVVGTDSVISSSGVKYSGKVNVQGATATVVGSKNTVDNNNGLVYSGVANNVMGSANTIEGSNGVTIQGTGNKVIGAYKDMGITLGEAYSIYKGNYSALAKKQSGAVAVVGGANTVSKQTDSTVIGYDNQLIGGTEKGSHDAFMAGSHNRLNNVSDSIVMGNKNAITGVSNVISFGHENGITASDAVAIGNGAGVSVEGGVALGVGSVADRAAGEVGYDPATGAKYVIPEDAAASYVWKATKGAVSVGGGRDTRQITNVAAGTADTDAVNVAQLKKVSETAANANKGWKLKTKNGNVSNVNPGDEVEFDGDANIQVGNVGNKVSVTLKDALTGITSITGAGEGAGSISFDGGIKLNNKVTIDNNGKISGVANGEISADSTDAVNGSQLNAVKETANKGWTLKTTNGNVSDVKPGDEVKFDGDDNIKVSNTGKDVKVELNKELTGLTSVITNNAYVTSVDASNNKSVTNVEYVKNQIADAALSAGNGISITDKKINVKLKDGEENLKVGETGLYLRKDLIGMESITGAGGGIISFAKDSKNVTINNITFNNDGRIQGVADGKVAKDAVNFGQLQAVKSDMQASDKRLVASADGSYKPDAKGDISLRVEDSKHEGYDVVIKDVAKASDVGDVNNIASDIKNQDGSHTTVVDAVNNLNNKVGDLNYVEGGKGNYVTNGENTTTSIGKLDKALKNVADTAAKHTKVEGSSNITVTNTAKEGEAANYKVELNKDIDVDTVKATTVTTGQTVMNNDGLKVGENVSVTGTAVTAGQASISNEGLAVGPNTSLKADELKVDGKTYIDKVGLNANGQHITNVKAGEADTDAVNYGQLKDTNNHIDRVENQVVNNTNRISNLDNRVNKVGAGAAALAALHPLDFDPDAKWDFAAGYGNYRGANAAAVGAYYRPNEDTMFSVGGTFGNGENMVNAGVSFKLGSGSSHVSTSRVAMAKEIKELRGELEAMKSAMLDANAGKKIDTSKLQLFPDVPQNHWAYEYVTQLAGNGMIEGYPDGNFAGDRPMTRYEFAAILYRAMTKGAVLSDKILNEFSHELEYFTVDTVAKDKAGNPTIQRVRTVKANTNK